MKDLIVHADKYSSVQYKSRKSMKHACSTRFVISLLVVVRKVRRAGGSCYVAHDTFVSFPVELTTVHHLLVSI